MSEAAERDISSYPTRGWGERMRLARQRADLTLEDVGRDLGITPGAISQWESEKTAPSRKNFDAFARLAGVEPEWLQFAFSMGRYQVGVRVPVRNPWALQEEVRSPLTIEVRHPCSEMSFAIEAWADMPLVDVRAGQILVIDPKLTPEPMDMVLVVWDGQPHVEHYIPENTLTVLMRQFLDAVDENIGDTGATARRVHAVVSRFRRQVPLGAQNIGSDVASYEAATGKRIVGVVVEHTRGRYGKSFPQEKSSGRG